MADARSVFNADPGRQSTLKVIWPELYDALAGKGKFAGPPRDPTCVIGNCPTLGVKGRTSVPAVGRIRANGHWACEAHIIELSDIPGGWPLKRLTPSEIGDILEEQWKGRR